MQLFNLTLLNINEFFQLLVIIIPIILFIFIYSFIYFFGGGGGVMMPSYLITMKLGSSSINADTDLYLKKTSV